MDTALTATTTSDDGWTSASSSAPETQPQADRGATPAPVSDVTVPSVATAVQPVTETMPAEATPAAPPTPAKDKRSPDARIGEITGKWRSAERQATEERTRRESLERELTELRAKSSAPPPAAPAPVASKPAPDWDTYESEGKSWKDYQRDTNAWLTEEVDRRAGTAAEAAAAKIQKQFEEQQTKAADARKAQFAEAAEMDRRRQHDARMTIARAKYSDLDQLVEQNLSDVQSPFLHFLIENTEDGPELLYHLASKPDEAHILAQLQPSQAVGDAIRDADSPTRLLSHFAQHPDAFARINTLPPQRALLALGRLDRQLEDATPGPSPVPPPSPVTRAAGPIRPVVPPPTTGTTARASLDTLDFSPEYVARANKLESEARKRRGL